MKKRTEQHHPSYGQIQISRVTSARNHSLYGSKLLHGDHIRLSIHKSKLVRDLSNDWHFRYSPPLVEVAMSENQFAHLISTLNSGSGTPCTIQYLNGEEIPEPPIDKEVETFKKEAKQTAERATKTAREGIEKLQAMMRGGPIRKSDLAEVVKLLEYAACDIDSNLPYIANQFEESMDSCITSAKMEFEAYINNRMLKLGEQGVIDKNQIAQLASGEDTPNDNG